MQARLFEEGAIPAWTTPDWYAQRERAPHLEQPGHQGRLQLAAIYALRALEHPEARTVVDLGAGDGGLLSLLDIPDKWGYDLQPSNVQGALQRGVDVMLADVLHDPIAWGDVAIATEIIEHLIDPTGFLAMVAEHSRWLVASSPAFETAESHYAFHCWAWDQEGYAELIAGAGYRVIAHELTGDFQVLLAERS
jgi:hypothetical protein